jgi:hypothetical protein
MSDFNLQQPPQLVHGHPELASDDGQSRTTISIARRTWRAFAIPAMLANAGDKKRTMPSSDARGR